MEKLLPILLSRAVEFHCRRGNRLGCDCDYCQLKREATVDIGNVKNYAPYHLKYWHKFQATVARIRDGCWTDEYIETIKTIRENKRQAWRERLEDAKQEQ